MAISEFRGNNYQDRRPEDFQVSFVGCVLATRERNWHDDSDFYAVVWNQEKGRCETVTYATTRCGGTDYNGAKVDATDQVCDQVKVWLRGLMLETMRLHDSEKASKAEVGRLVRIVHGRKDRRGLVGRVVREWWGSFAPVYRNGYNKEQRRLWIDTGAGPRIWVADHAVEVVDQDQYRTPEADLVDRVDRMLQAMNDANSLGYAVASYLNAGSLIFV